MCACEKEREEVRKEAAISSWKMREEDREEGVEFI